MDMVISKASVQVTFGLNFYSAGSSRTFTKTSVKFILQNLEPQSNVWFIMRM